MEEFFNVLGESLWATIASPIFLSALLGLIILGGVLVYLDKRKSKQEHSNVFDLGLNKSNEEHLKELEDIKKLMGSGSNKPIEVDATNALYIARHFDQYNLLASEKGTVVFERLLQVGDTIEATLDEPQQVITKENKETNIQSLEVLPNGDIRLMRAGGYTVFKDGLIVGSKVFDESEDQKKKQAQPNKDKPNPKQTKKSEAMQVANALREDIIVTPKRKEEQSNIETAPLEEKHLIQEDEQEYEDNASEVNEHFDESEYLDEQVEETLEMTHDSSLSENLSANS
ncbi:MAG: hypothetical protein EOM50_17790, partial [Erysipelotrichia bacterium]|nr:hypothetical protein [Erysipelotrichia bacterium]